MALEVIPAEDTFGYLGEFADATALKHAVEQVIATGYLYWDAYTPNPVAELSECVRERKPAVSVWTFTGGVTGFLTGYIMQWYSAVWSYPILVGGKPLNSIPAFCVICFELTILFGAIATVLGLFWGLRLPMYYHPVFNVEAFSRASRDKFFLCLEAEDKLYAGAATGQQLERLGATHVYAVPK